MPAHGDPNDWVCDDPDASRNPHVLSQDLVKKYLYDGKDGKRWAKAKVLKRADVWAAAGFGSTDKLDKWTIEELRMLADAFADHCGKKYTAVKSYGICCSCG